jgi:hypothetical protein
MVDVVFSNDQLSVLGGPSELNLSLDFGPPGSRGTYIFTGDGKPTDDNVTILSASLPAQSTPQIFDFYINLKPSDNEYLFLYQYQNVNGVATWERILRLIPNTAIANIDVEFLNGQAVRTVNEQKLPGLIFPLNDFFSIDELGILDSANFNVQYSILAKNDPELFDPINNPSGLGIVNNPISSSVTLGPILANEVQGTVFLPVLISALESTVIIDPETTLPVVSWQPLTGIRSLNIAVTANIGNTSEQDSQ